MSATAGGGRRRELSSDAIRADIEATRERLGLTVETLGSQLNPSHLAQRVKENVREATIGRVQNMVSRAKENAVEGGRGLAALVRENPLPAAMIAAGIGWMLMKNRREPAPRYRSEFEPDENRWRQERDSEGPNVAQRAWSTAAGAAEDTAEAVQEKVREVADKTQETVRDVADKAQNVAHDVGQKARTATHRVAEKTRETMHGIENRYRESPIVLGAFAVAAGLAIGLALPSTRKESELMGSARDQLVDKAKEQLTETAEKVENVVERAAPRVQDVVREAAREERAQGSPGMSGPSGPGPRV